MLCMAKTLLRLFQIVVAGGGAKVVHRLTNVMGASLDWLGMWMLLSQLGFWAWTFKGRDCKDSAFLHSVLLILPLLT